MSLFLAALAVLLLGGLGALAASRSPRAANLLGARGAVLGCAFGGTVALRVLAGEDLPALRAPWRVPYASFHLEVDALSAFFLLPIFGLSALAAVYATGYLRPFGGRRSLGPPWFFTNLLVAGMALVVVARNAILFLVAWEVMSLAAFFLVAWEDEREEVRDAGWTYLVATHLGTAFLLALFVLLGREGGSFEFEAFRAGAQPGALFLLALVGFGTKAGFVPLHVWLPEAHPAAPSHASALLSGVMIKTGLYGLVRTVTFLGTPPAWWGWVLVGVGATSGILGVLFAIAQHDLKRLLAYHSVENVGIIALGLGLGSLGWTYGAPWLAAFGLAGALLHVLNHALFKGLLFLGAGSVLHATETREIDRLGGLGKRMPATGVAFLVGAAAITGLPPLNGFVSEFLIFLGALRGGTSSVAGVAVPGLAAIGSLALIGGLAAACFAKAFGVVFLGEPRSGEAARARESGPAMVVPMALLAAACAAIGLFPGLALRIVEPAVREVLPGPDAGWRPAAAAIHDRAALAGGGFLVLAAALALLRRALLRRRPVGETVTWDCGYVRPSARMQYSSSSFAQPLTELFGILLRTRKRIVAPRGPFPAGASVATETPDPFRERLYGPAFAAIARGAAALRWIQIGRVHVYVLYVALSLLVLLAWKLG